MKTKLEEMRDEAKAEGYKEGINQIFAELKKHDTGYGDIVLSTADWRELKEKYGVD
jgi:hypothetical protein